MCAVHPRWCGEHPCMPICLPTKCGSSPLVRGTWSTISIAFLIARFIPAGAGNMYSRTKIDCLFVVHPRWCGEHWVRKGWGRMSFGSSPLVRGTCGFYHRAHRKKRFIPAGAGNIA